MKIKLFSPKIEITESLDELIKTLEVNGVKFSDSNGIIFFKGVLEEGLPEFSFNIHFKRDKITYINVGYNYEDENDKDYPNHKLLITNYMSKSFGNYSKKELDDESNAESYKWFIEHEKVVCNLNGAGFYYVYRRETDIFIQFIFNMEGSNKLSTHVLKLACLIVGVVICGFNIVYKLIEKNFNDETILWSCLLGLVLGVGLYFIFRFLAHNNLYSARVDKRDKRLIEEYHKQAKFNQCYVGKFLAGVWLFESMCESRLYFTDDKMIIAYVFYGKLKTIEVAHLDHKKVSSSENYVILEIPGQKGKRYFEAMNELVADEIKQLYKNYIGRN